MPPVLSKFDKIEQRAVIKFCVKVGKSAAETVEQLENSLKRRAVYQCHKYFSGGDRMFKTSKERK